MGVDRSAVIVAQVLIDGIADDAKTALNLTDEADIANFTADAAGGRGRPASCAIGA